MEEIWKDVPGFEGLYQISNRGRCKLQYRPEKFLKPGVNWGYLIFILSKNDVNKCIRAHRAVALAFIPNPENKPEVNHINMDKQDNRVENLEWVTPKENIRHAINTKHQWRICGRAKIVLNIETGIFYDTIKDAANSTNHISRSMLNWRFNNRVSNNTNFILA